VHWFPRVYVCLREKAILPTKLRISLVTAGVVVAAMLPNSVTGQTLLGGYGLYPEPPIPARPAAGATLVDPTFGTTIMRLTDANDGTDCRVEYSYWPTFNVNSTRAKALCVVAGVSRTRIWSFDPTNFRRGAGILMPMRLQSSDPIWSGSDPNVIYGHSTTHVLLAFNVSTQTTTTLKDFSIVVPAGGQLNQMSMSSDDDTFAFHVTNSAGSPVGYLVWQRSTNTLLLNRLESAIDEVQVDKTGRYLEVGYTNGNNRIWDLQTKAYTNLTWGVDGFFHHDSGRGTMLTYNGRGNALAYRQLSSPHTLVALMSLSSSNKTGHLSMRADNESWGLASNYNNDGRSASAPFDNEIFQVATDGSGDVRRIAHHRSVFNDYYDGPFANISRDGRFVAFSSNWGVASGRRDVFVARIPPAPGSETPPPPPAPPSCPEPTSGAFTGCYYADNAFGNLVLARTDSYPLTFNWGNGSPDPAVPADGFSAQWQGRFAFTAGSYEFTLTVDDGARLYVDGQLILNSWVNQPATTYTVSKVMTAGTHTIRLEYYEAYAGAVARLSWAANGTSTSTSGDTTPPSVPTGLRAGPVSSTTAGVTWAASTDNVGVVGYRIYMDGRVLGNVAVPSVTISPISCGTSHSVRVDAVDAAGNRSAQSAPLAVTTVACSDAIAPKIAITSPSADATVTGTITLRASATDNIGVVGVRFAVDGIQIGGEVAGGNAAISWISRNMPNGWHQITATARDAAGNRSTSAIRVHVRNRK
jgi:hypothetical protein